jgi:hypothetical protein
VNSLTLTGTMKCVVFGLDCGLGIWCSNSFFLCSWYVWCSLLRADRACDLWVTSLLLP